MTYAERIRQATRLRYILTQACADEKHATCRPLVSSRSTWHGASWLCACECHTDPTRAQRSTH